MKVRLFAVTVDGARTANQAIALAGLAAGGDTIDYLDVSSTGLPRGAGRAARRTEHRFTHTPEPLIESWRVAHHIARRSDPGDIVVVADCRGIGGMAALREAAQPPSHRRRIWTIAGDGLFLRSMLITGTAEGLDAEGTSAIDWELVQYRYSEKVIATSQAAVDLMRGIGVNAQLVTQPRSSPGHRREARGSGVWAPESVSRESRTGDVMRAVASLPDLPLTVSTADAEDRMWSGSTWETLRSVREILGERLQRAEQPANEPKFVVIGDALRPPEPATVAWHATGVPILAVADSVATAMWPNSPTWGTADDLAALLSGVSQPEPIFVNRVSEPPVAGVPDDSRARLVSVGIPVFRSVEYLDECLESIVAQSSPAHEILLIDDGSNSEDVDRALAKWASRERGRLRILRQPNRGVCVARNHMISEMTGDAFLLVDQDDVLAPTFIERTGEALRSDDTLWAVAAWTEFFGDYEGIEAKPPFDRRIALRENPIVSTGALVDMRVRDEHIAFAPDLAFLYCEDWHYWSQIIAAGGRMGLVPEALIRHRVHRASGGFQRTELAHRIGRARAIEPLLRYERPSD